MKNKIIQSLSEQAYRITPAREKMIEYFSNIKNPLSAIQIIELFKKDKVKVHRATVYREIEFLLSHDVIHSLYLGQEAASYELNNLQHHHHFICEKCGNVVDVAPKEIEEALEKYEAQLMQKRKIKVNFHSLKFFGTCRTCMMSQKKGKEESVRISNF